MIYTSHFWSWKIKLDDPRLVSIARYSPKQYKGATCLKLAPSPELLKHWKRTYDKRYYIDTFSTMLSGYDADHAYMALDGKILLCYEKPEQFCHRHLVAHWFNEFGYKCEEL